MAKHTRSLRHRLAIAFLRLYPGAWRRRYQAEQTALLEDSRPDWSKVVDVARGAFHERFHLRLTPQWTVEASGGGWAE